MALAAGLTKEQAAKEAGCSLRTVYRRLESPEFRQQVDAARAATITQTAARLTAAGLTAVSTLLKLLQAESESVRLGSARAILELGTKLRESEDLANRIAALEQRIGHPEGQRRWVS